MKKLVLSLLFLIPFGLASCNKESVVPEVIDLSFPQDFSMVEKEDMKIEEPTDMSTQIDMTNFDLSISTDMPKPICFGKIPFDLILSWWLKFTGDPLCEEKPRLVLSLNGFCNKYCGSTFDNFGPFLIDVTCDKAGTSIIMPTYEWIECKY